VKAVATPIVLGLLVLAIGILIVACGAGQLAYVVDKWFKEAFGQVER